MSAMVLRSGPRTALLLRTDVARDNSTSTRSRPRIGRTDASSPILRGQVHELDEEILHVEGTFMMRTESILSGKYPRTPFCPIPLLVYRALRFDIQVLEQDLAAFRRHPGCEALLKGFKFVHVVSVFDATPFWDSENLKWQLICYPYYPCLQ
jgi:hypothetical protein